MAMTALASIRQRLATMAVDYAAASKDTWSMVRHHPVRTAVAATLVSTLVLALKKAPTERDFINELNACANDFAMLPNSADQRKESAFQWIMSMKDLAGQGRLCHKNLLFFTIVLKEEASQRCSSYRHRLGSFRFNWQGIDAWRDRIVDVGIWKTWFILRRQMVDYDVPEE